MECQEVTSVQHAVHSGGCNAQHWVRLEVVDDSECGSFTTSRTRRAGVPAESRGVHGLDCVVGRAVVASIGRGGDS
jgi:hypothetical protein